MEIEPHPKSGRKAILTLDNEDEEHLIRRALSPRDDYRRSDMPPSISSRLLISGRGFIHMGFMHSNFPYIPETFPASITVTHKQLKNIENKLREREDLDRGYTVDDSGNQRPMAYLRRDMVAQLGNYIIDHCSGAGVPPVWPFRGK